MDGPHQRMDCISHISFEETQELVLDRDTIDFLRMKTMTITIAYGVFTLHMSNDLKINSRPRVAEVRPNSPTHKFEVKIQLVRNLRVKKLSSAYGVRLETLSTRTVSLYAYVKIGKADRGNYKNNKNSF
ncbi:hypothetical protein ElyMa_000573400 [Elysia marginata]|uniref:Uncharacterized protein n=1 Tax=Elysia marginata TaxID=1093978 RepID=A0AAV4G628_9GAST|nr:hypothetical protein ElyMa_000573400 [Elysia marginata]